MDTKVIQDALFNATGHHEYQMQFRSHGLEFRAAGTTLFYKSLDDLEQDALAGLSKFVTERKRMQREKYVCKINDLLWQVASAMREMAGDDNMVSVQINSEFKAILRIGAQSTEHMTLRQLAAKIYEVHHP